MTPAIIPGQITISNNGVQEVFYKPHPHQARFHAATEKNVLMTGGAGSGKSLAMRMEGYLRCLSIPRYRAALFRRKMPELRMSHLDHIPFELKRLGIPVDAFHQTNNVIRFPNGSTFLFRQIEDDLSLSDFLSAEWDIHFWDELTTFSLKQYKFLSSRLRTTIPGVVPLMRGGTNPTGQYAQWVKRYFVDKDIRPEEDPAYRPGNYLSLFSTIDDNPSVNLEDYEERLLGMPTHALRQAYRYGEWSIEGQFFSEWSTTKDGAPWHVIPKMPTYHGTPLHLCSHSEVVRSVDWGYSATGNPGVCLWFVCLPDGSAIAFQEWTFKETLPEDAAREILRRSAGMRVRYTVADTAVWAEHSGPSIGEKFARAGLSMIEADKEREAGWVEMHTWLREKVDDGTGPRPRLSFLETGCPVTISAIPSMVVDPKRPQDMTTVGVEDDGPDAVRYFVMSRPGRSRAPRAIESANVTEVRKVIEQARRKRFRLGGEAYRR